MSGSVTQCLECHENVWAGTKVCPSCGSRNIGATLREVAAYYEIQTAKREKGESKENGRENNTGNT